MQLKKISKRYYRDRERTIWHSSINRTYIKKKHGLIGQDAVRAKQRVSKIEPDINTYL